MKMLKLGLAFALLLGQLSLFSLSGETEERYLPTGVHAGESQGSAGVEVFEVTGRADPLL